MMIGGDSDPGIPIPKLDNQENWIGSKTTDECGDEYIRVGIVQETSTYECLGVRRRIHTTGDEYIRVPRSEETST